MPFLTKFGKMLKTIRIEKGLTIADVVAISNHGISKNTLLRYESGQQMPKYELLEMLSSVYSLDLCDYFYRFQSSSNDYDSNIKQLLQKNLSLEDAKHLHELLQDVIQTNQNSPLIPYYDRLLLFANGAIAKHNGNYEQAESFFLMALKQRFCSFRLEHYSDYVYLSLDFKILDNYIDTLRYLKKISNEYAIEIYQYLYAICPPNDFSFAQICIQLAYFYAFADFFHKSLEILEKGISQLRENNRLNHLPQLYYAKGHIEYASGSPDAQHDFLISYRLSEAMGDTKRLQWLRKKCTEIFHFSIDNFLSFE